MEVDILLKLRETPNKNIFTVSISIQHAKINILL